MRSLPPGAEGAQLPCSLPPLRRQLRQIHGKQQKRLLWGVMAITFGVETGSTAPTHTHTGPASCR